MKDFPVTVPTGFWGLHKLKSVPVTPAWGPSRTRHQGDHSFGASEHAPESPSSTHLIDISVHLSAQHHILYWGYKKEKTKPLSPGTQDLMGAQGGLHACFLTHYPTPQPWYQEVRQDGLSQVGKIVGLGCWLPFWPRVQWNLRCLEFAAIMAASDDLPCSTIWGWRVIL